MRIQLRQSDIWNIWFYNDEVLCVSLATHFGPCSRYYRPFYSPGTYICDWHNHVLLKLYHTLRMPPYPNFGVQKVHISWDLAYSRPKHITLLASSYASSRNDTSFISYFASTTPESEHKRARLKTVLMLAGSSLYDPDPIRQRLLEKEKILKFELAIIDGKVRSVTCFIVDAL